ncbi:type II toxin-antitoxin system HicB family antitoxin [Candidatus Parcubacteria bacterium]|nr:MAG: type II toxin-antitoxin system HicB family antitoxin [Candidatus Parcubacteria bacterium]
MYIASVPSLKGCHTQAKNLDDLLPRIREAIELCLEVQDENVAPPVNFIGVQQIEVAV